MICMAVVRVEQMSRQHISVYCYMFACVCVCVCRAEACAGKLAELNPYVQISTLTEPLTVSTDPSYLQQFQVLTAFLSNQRLFLHISCRDGTHSALARIFSCLRVPEAILEICLSLMRTLCVYIFPLIRYTVLS